MNLIYTNIPEYKWTHSTRLTYVNVRWEMKGGQSLPFSYKYVKLQG